MDTGSAASLANATNPRIASHGPLDNFRLSVKLTGDDITDNNGSAARVRVRLLALEFGCCGSDPSKATEKQ